MTRAVNYRDHDRILTLLTRDGGRMSASARGCRKAQSKLLACAQPFCYGDFELYGLHGHAYVRQCDVREIFYDLRLRVEAVEAAAYACAVCEAMAVPGEPFVRGFSLLLHTLKALCDPEGDVDAVLTFFLIKLMAFEGYCLYADACVHCEATQGLNAFDIGSGGVVCERCRQTTRGAAPLSHDMLTALRALPNTPSAAYQSVSRALTPIAARLLPIVEDVFAGLLGQPLPKRTFIRWENQ